MAALFSNLPYELGDYKVQSWLSQSDSKDYYIAHQTHIDRHVLLEINMPSIDEMQNTRQNAQFLADAKVKANYEFQRVKAIFGSAQRDNYIFNVYDMPKGRSLSSINENGEKLSILAICKLIEQCAQLYQDISIKNLKTESLSLEKIFYIDESHYEFLSPLISDHGNGGSTEEEQIKSLVQCILNFIPDSAPGINRLLTLLNWMHVGFEGQMLPWNTLSSTASLIIEQVYPDRFQKLQNEYSTLIGSRQRKKTIKKRLSIARILIGAIILLLGILALCSYTAKGARECFRKCWEDAYYLENSKFYIQAKSQATSIQDYDNFLKALSSLDREKSDQLHSGLPKEARQHSPLDWESQLQAAENSSMYEGRRMNRNAPVVGVNYWDALVYARYKHAELPSLNILISIPRKANEARIEEWSAGKSEDPIYGQTYHIFSYPNNFKREFNASTRDNNRGFRIIQKSHTKPNS